MSEKKINKDCPCVSDCERHGDCEACRAQHAKSGKPTSCLRLELEKK